MAQRGDGGPPRPEPLDTVRLNDGRPGCVVEILGDRALSLVDVGSSPEDWETIEVEPREIAEILPR